MAAPRPGHPVTVYVLMPSADDHDGAVVPVDAAAGTAGPAIGLHASDFIAGGIAVTPDGKTALVTATTHVGPHHYEIVTPVRTATNTAGRAFSIGPPVEGAGNQVIAITPDSKTLYVASYGDGTVIPVNTVTSTYGRPIKVGRGPS